MTKSASFALGLGRKAAWVTVRNATVTGRRCLLGARWDAGKLIRVSRDRAKVLCK